VRRAALRTRADHEERGDARRSACDSGAAGRNRAGGTRGLDGWMKCVRVDLSCGREQAW